MTESAMAFTWRSLSALINTRKSAYEARPRTSRMLTFSAFLSRPAWAAVSAATSASSFAFVTGTVFSARA
jgi:hypothetical protein